MANRESPGVRMPLWTYEVRLGRSSERMTYPMLMACDAERYEGAVAICQSRPDADVVELRNGEWILYREKDE